MCNLFKKDRLFKVSNPCCCCSLPCGTLWICIFSFCLGFGSIFLPFQLGIRYDWVTDTSISTLNKDIVVKKHEWMDQPFYRFVIHYGCQLIQMLTAFYLGATDVCKCGGLCNFISGTVWIVGRIFITALWVPLLYRIPAITRQLADDYKWKRYGVVLGANLIIHLYFIIVVRYYTMEAWDIWSYRPRTPDFRHPLRRNIPPEMKGRDRKFVSNRRPNAWESLTEYRQGRLRHGPVHPELRDRNNWDLEGGIPMWQFGKDFLVRGEDYSGFDPMWNYQNFQRLADTGVLDWDAEDLLNEDKLEVIHEMLLATENIPPRGKEIVRKKDSEDSINSNDGPFMAGFISGHIPHLRRCHDTNPGHGYDPEYMRAHPSSHHLHKTRSKFGKTQSEHRLTSLTPETPLMDSHKNSEMRVTISNTNQIQQEKGQLQSVPETGKTKPPPQSILKK